MARRKATPARREAMGGLAKGLSVIRAFTREEAEGLRAVCHQHEIDQLNGVFWINRLSRLKRDRLIKRFEKVSRG